MVQYKYRTSHINHSKLWEHDIKNEKENNEKWSPFRKFYQHTYTDP